MKKTSKLGLVRNAAVLITVALLFSSCASTTQVVGVNGVQSLTTDRLDPQDLQATAEQLINEMVASGVLDKCGPAPIRVAFKGFTNYTSTNVDTAALGVVIKKYLTNSDGRILITSDDVTTQQMQKRADFMGEKSSVAETKLVMHGTIRESITREGNKKQYNYTLHMAIDKTQGDVGNVWNDFKTISKQVKRKAVGL